MTTSHYEILTVSQNKAVYRAIRILERAMVKSENIFNSPERVKDFLKLKLGFEQREVFAVMFLDAQNRLIEYANMFYGTVHQAPVYPREVVKKALSLNAVSVIFSHNHPSGVAAQSNADELLTKQLKEALDMVDVRTLDHIVIAGNNALSFAEKGLL